MQISVLDEQSGAIYSFDVEPDTTIGSIKSLIESESKVPSARQTILFNGNSLSDGDSLGGAGVKEDDLLYMRQSAPPVQQNRAATTTASSAYGGGFGAFGGQQQQPDLSAMSPEQILNYFRSNTLLMQQLAASNPQLHSIIQQGNADVLMRVLAPIIEKQREERLYARLEANPFDVEAQRELEELIRQRNVQENYLTAMEHSPESFASVIMLYINCKVNNVPLKAFIDSGAQMSIMSKECAERCNLLRLLDTRFQGMAVGVGSAKIVGRIHLTTMQVGQSHFPITITVLDQKGMDFLLGLDMLKRHQCQIDLKDNVLRIGPEAAPFLQEKDLKDVLKKEQLEPQSPLSPKFSSPSSSSSRGTTASATAASSSSGAATSTAAATAPSQQQSASGGLPAFVTEEKIKSITDLGFTRQQAIDALTATGGNADAAASLLFQ